LGKKDLCNSILQLYNASVRAKFVIVDPCVTVNYTVGFYLGYSTQRRSNRVPGWTKFRGPRPRVQRAPEFQTFF